MLYHSRSWRRCLRPYSRFFYLFLLSFILTIIWSTFSILLFDKDDNDFEGRRPPSIFCFVLSGNDRHSRAIIYSWGKLCDRFYIVARLQNSSIDLMTLEKFEDISNVTSTTITQYTLDVLLYLLNENLFSSYKWFLRATDDSFVIVSNLRKLVNQLHHIESYRPIAYVGDVEQMYEKYDILSTGSVMLFNRHALEFLYKTAVLDDEDEDENNKKKKPNLEQKCFEKMIYDHEFVSCMKQIHIDINPLHENLILSQNLSMYKMDKRLKVKYK